MLHSPITISLPFFVVTILGFKIAMHQQGQLPHGAWPSHPEHS